jgi:hypothetical protein
MKFGLSQYFQPTPKKIRTAADAVVAATTFGGSMIVLNGDPKVGTAIFIVGVVAKFISNLFAEDNEQKKKANKSK